MDRPVMICGLDVYRAPKLEGKSVVGYCTSFNNSATKYWSKSIILDSGVEVASLLKSMMIKSLTRFK
jgi:hypothetical protein